MQLAAHLRLERQAQLILGDEPLVRAAARRSAAPRAAARPATLVGRLVEDPHLEQHLAEQLGRAGQRHRDRDSRRAR